PTPHPRPLVFYPVSLHDPLPRYRIPCMSAFTLKPLPGYTPFPGPVVLAILAGVGLGPRDESDGVYLAHTPVLDALLKEPLYTPLDRKSTRLNSSHVKNSYAVFCF